MSWCKGCRASCWGAKTLIPRTCVSRPFWWFAMMPSCRQYALRNPLHGRTDPSQIHHPHKAHRQRMQLAAMAENPPFAVRGHPPFHLRVTACRGTCWVHHRLAIQPWRCSRHLISTAQLSSVPTLWIGSAGSYVIPGGCSATTSQPTGSCICTALISLRSRSEVPALMDSRLGV